MDLLGILGVGVAAVALIVSIWSGVSSRRTANRQNELQERLLALETAREQDRLREARSAQVRAGIARGGRGDYRLVVVNEGRATARNVKVILDGAPLLAHALVLRRQEEISKLGPGVDARYILAVSTVAQTALDARITWDDDTGEARSWESELKIF
jgi:hypothetical protein